jgi:hypothetical protein
LDGSSKLLGTFGQGNIKKQGLPHIHLLLIFPLEQKVSTIEDMDHLVSLELPFPENAPLFETVTKCLLHGPYGQKYPNAPCMVNSVCKKCYLRAFSKEITQGEDEYPIYYQQNDG